MTFRSFLALSFGLLSACATHKVGAPPEITPVNKAPEQLAFHAPAPPLNAAILSEPAQQASLWTGSRRSLLGDRRAQSRGDILTVIIEIDDSAEISNASQRGRSGSETMGVPELFGLPQRADASLPEGASLANAVSISSKSQAQGDGSVRRNEKLTLRIAAAIINVTANGTLEIKGTQEVRVNNELRELLISGYVRPEDISRQNQITYDKIASARISYGGRGQITDMQQPRYGQQVADRILPF